MDEVKQLIRHTIKNSPEIPYDDALGDTSNPDYVGPLGVDRLVDELYSKLEKYCTDLTPKSSYPCMCAYCYRPAESTYG